MRWIRIACLVVASCGSKTAGPGGNGSGGSGSGSGVIEPPIPTGTAKTCEELKPRLGELYRAEGQVKEPKRVDEFIADNTQMILNDCAKDPARVVACVNAARSVTEVEAKCVAPLDEEGSEGMELRK